MIFNIHSRQSIRFEDDASLSSTLTVDRATKPLVDEDDQSIASTASCSTVCKSVRFNLDDNQEFENKQICFEDCAAQWYSFADYKRFRAHTQALAKEIAKAESRNRAPFSYQRVMMRTYDVCCASVYEPNGSILSVDERRHMNRWAEVAPSRLGLEKWAIKPIGRDRSNRRHEMVDVVLDMQDSVEGENADELIRQRAESISRASRLFARSVAQAQATALSRDSYYGAC